MTIKDKASVAWSNLGRRKVRTALTSVGVVVGIMTVVTMISLVNGVQEQVKQQFEKIGLNQVTVRPPGEGLFGGAGGGFGGGGFNLFDFGGRDRGITPADVQRWKSWPDVEEVVPEIELPGSIGTGFQMGNHKPIRVRVGNNSRPQRGPFAEAPEALAGSLNLPDRRGSVVVSRGLLRKFGIRSNFGAELGKNAQIVLRTSRGETQSYPLKISGVSSDDRSSVELTTPDRLAMKGWWFNEKDLLKKTGYDSVTLRADDVTKARNVVARLRAEKENGKTIGWGVQSIDAILDVANRIFAAITAMLALVSSVALLVASIGIANTMIMSIYERTREIGTLKAMGASRGDIRQMFMLEAGFIGLFGGAMGLFSSWVIGRALNSIAHWFAQRRGFPLPDQLFIITPTLIFESLAFAFLIGVVAGLYPANRAARLDPLVALRHE